MPIIKEPLNGGVVQTRHPLLLRPGELQRGEDCIYRPGDPAIHRAPGRTVYGTVRSTPITTTTNFSSVLASTSAFGTDIAAVTVTSGSDVISKAAALGGLSEGQTVVGTGIPAGTYVRRLISTTDVQLSQIATATGSVIITHSNLHPGTYIVGDGIPHGTTVASITDASTLVMSVPAQDGSTASRAFTEAVQGLRGLYFDHIVSDLLIAKAADKIYYSPITATTGTFTELLHGMSQDADASLETIQHRNQHILLTGFDLPRLLYYQDNGSNMQVPTTRALGMKPVTDFIGPAIVPGTWSSLTTFQNGWYYFIITEVMNPGTDLVDTPYTVEGTYTGKPKGIHVTDYNTQGIQITYTAAASTPVNNGLYGANTATHWRVYMAPKQSEELPAPDLTAFIRVATIPISSNSVILKDSNPYQSGWARTVASYGGFDALFPYVSAPALSAAAKQTRTATTAANSNVLSSVALFGTVTVGMTVTSTTVGNIPYGTIVIRKDSASSLIMSNNAVAIATETIGFGDTPTWDDAMAGVPANAATYRAGEFRDFGINNIGGFPAGTITGVLVEVRGQWLADNDRGDDRGFYISLVKGGSTISDGGVERSINFPQGSYRTGVMAIGGPQDTWGISWVPADFIDGAATFAVRLKKHGSSVAQYHLIDGIKVTIYAGGTAINLDGEPFKTIVVSDQVSGESFGVGAALNPPIATTGDVVDGMCVMNDTNDESAIVTSLPNDFDAYPSIYRLPLEGKENDKVRVIKRLGNATIVGCQNSVKRINYFPKESDPEFLKGKCYENIAEDHGMVGPRAAKIVNMPGRGPVLAYLAYNGMHWTDSISTTPLNEDLDWENLIEPTLIHRSVLEVYPRLYLLALTYVPRGETRKTKVMYFSYHPAHIKEGLRLPAIGPVGCEAASLANFLLNGVPYLFSGHSADGTVYLEDSGIEDTSWGDIVPVIQTRQFYGSDIGREGRLERTYLITDADGDATTGVVTAVLTRQNQGEVPTPIRETNTDTSFGGILELWPDDAMEVFDMTFSKTATQLADMRIHYIVLVLPDAGEETNG